MLLRLPVGALKKAGVFGPATRSASVCVIPNGQLATDNFFDIQQVRFASSATVPNAQAFQVSGHTYFPGIFAQSEC